MRATQKMLELDRDRGWVTKKSADGGIDFVTMLPVGSIQSGEGGDIASTNVVVLGQAKCIKPDNVVSGKDVARLVARLKRGWIGVFVTTGVFGEAVQKEIAEDSYPVICINGKKLSEQLRLLMNETGKDLEEFLEEQAEWYNKNLQEAKPEDVIENADLTPVLNDT